MNAQEIGNGTQISKYSFNFAIPYRKRKYEIIEIFQSIKNTAHKFYWMEILGNIQQLNRDLSKHYILLFIAFEAIL